MRRTTKTALIIALVFAVAGCNFFNWMHPPGRSDNTDVLMADGRAALNAGNYKEAQAIFEKVLAANPRNAQARVGHATAVIHLAGADFIRLAMSLASDDQKFSLADASKYGLDSLGELRQLVSVLISDLEPIRKGQTDGSVAMDDADVNLVLTIAYTVKAAVNLEDLIGFSFMLDEGSWDTLPAASLTQSEADELIDLIEAARESAEILLATLDLGEDVDVSDLDARIDELIQLIQDAVIP